MAENKNVLVVEDDPFLSQLLVGRLEKAGVGVTQAHDGEEAVEVLKSFKPNLILLDLILPKKSGFEVMEEIKKDPLVNNAPIIIISNLSQESDVSRGLELGAIEYYVKARTSIDDLVKKISDLLSSTQSRAGK